MKPATVKRLRLLASALGVLLLIVLVLGAWFYIRMRASLPQLDGSAAMTGLGARVTVERDAQGVPTLRGANRNDVARALGFIHAQDRFFQMDCTRRHAAGELAELCGKVALAHDRRVRIHNFRTLAQTVLAKLPAEQRALVEAYTAGANAGLAALKTEPFEYLLLRENPQPWKAEDCVLMIYAMALDLQDEDAVYERSLATLNDTLGRSSVAYFAPLLGPDDAALDGTTGSLAPMPTDHMIDIRKRVYEYEDNKKHAYRTNTESPEVLPGSNAFALSGEHTTTGAGLVANDMHLTLRVPNTWYRASLIFPSAKGDGETRITGVTIPGAPLVVAGSNGHIAWGFTNAYVDTTDLIIVNVAAGAGTYMNRDEVMMYEKRSDTIRVHGQKPESIDYMSTIWGPIIGANADKRDLALKWTEHDPAATNFDLFNLESARTVQEAVEIAHRTGIPPQNFIVADADGAIAWTICGQVPKRVGYDGRLSATWSFGDRRWDGFLKTDEVPTLIAPKGGRLWSANQRMAGDDFLRVLGDGGYERPLRAGRIRDLLAPLEKASALDLLAVQLDVRASYLDRWQQLFLKVLSPEAIAQKKGRPEMRSAAEKWEGQASVDSVSYRLVAAFRQHVVDRVLPVVFEPCYDAYPDFNFRRFHYENALWDMVVKKPMHLLGQDYANWDELLLAAADDVFQEVKKEHGSVARATWGSHNAAKIQHPLANIFPWPLSRCLEMPADPLPGASNVPRVQSPSDGASERFVVSPGHEAEGIFEMPGGQSGHPLSPFFRAGHEAWVKGEPTPFLPGPAAHTLTLTP